MNYGVYDTLAEKLISEHASEEIAKKRCADLGGGRRCYIVVKVTGTPSGQVKIEKPKEEKKKQIQDDGPGLFD